MYGKYPKKIKRRLVKSGVRAFLILIAFLYGFAIAGFNIVRLEIHGSDICIRKIAIWNDVRTGSLLV